MRLESVRLTDFRGVSSSLVEFAPGVTVVCGPNEVGKSSVREAIRLVRDFKHSSRHQALRAVQPVGRDVGPQVELRLTTGPYRVRLAKRWLRETYAELEVTGPRHEQLSGDAAHDRFNAILAETVDVQLLQALDVAQGRSLELPKLADIAALHAALDETGGRDDADGTDALLERIEQEYARFFTGGGRPTGDYRATAARLPELEAAVEDLREQSRLMDRRTADHEREVRQLATDEDQLARATDELERWRERDRGLAESRERLRLRTEELAEAERAKQEADLVLATRTEESRGLAERATRIADLQEEVRGLSESARRADDHRTEAQSQATAAGELLHAARRRASRAGLALGRAQDAAELAEIERRLAQARAAEEQRVEAVARIEAARVDPATLEQLGELDTRLRLARLTREAAAARVLVHRLGTAAVTVGDQAVERVADVRATEPLTIEAEGVLRVEVEPGAGPADLGREVAAAQETFDAALTAAGVDSLTGARRAATERAEALAARDRAAGTLEVVLAGRSMADLTEQVAALTARIAAHAPGPEEPGEPDEPVGDLRAAVDEAERAVAHAEQAGTEASERLESARASAQTAHEALLRAQVALEEQSAEHDLARDRLTRARATLSDDDAARAVERADRRIVETAEAVAAARAELAAADAERVELELTNAGDVLESARERLAGTKERLVRVGTLLEESAKLGIYDRLAAAEAELEAARAAYERMDRSARAIRLLRETMHRHRDAAHRRYVAPFKASIDRLGRLVFGPGFEVQIDEELQISSRTLDGDTVPFDSLSAGAREQLALLGRLACAQLIDAVDGAPVVLDDTLGFADPDRLRALNVVLATVGREAQVVVFTCQEERFTGVGGATTVRLPTL